MGGEQLTRQTANNPGQPSLCGYFILYFQASGFLETYLDIFTVETRYTAAVNEWVCLWTGFRSFPRSVLLLFRREQTLSAPGSDVRVFCSKHLVYYCPLERMLMCETRMRALIVFISVGVVSIYRAKKKLGITKAIYLVLYSTQLYRVHVERACVIIESMCVWKQRDRTIVVWDGCRREYAERRYCNLQSVLCMSLKLL